MDQKSKKNQNNYHPLITKTLHILVPVSIFSLFLVLHNLHFSSLNFTLLDRKYMFLICNGILAVLAKNLKLSSSKLNYVQTAEDGGQQITEMPGVLEEDAVQENAASVDYTEIVEDGVQQITEMPRVLEEEEIQENAASEDHIDNVAVVEEEEQVEVRQEIKGGDFVLECEEEEDDDDDDDDDDIEESGSLEGILVNDARISTEELNKKFEEFIMKMKEELRIEARQHLIAV